MTPDRAGIAVDRYEPLLVRLAAGCRRLYGDRLTSVVVHGSVARGEARPDSDVDVLVVAEGLPGWWDRGDEFRPVFDAFTAEARARGFDPPPYLSAIQLCPDEALRTRPLYLDMTLFARFLYDRDGFFETRVLAPLRRRMRALGSRRVPIEGGWYWDLKPDIQFGEIVEL